MGESKKAKDFGELNRELLELLTAQDPGAIQVINEIKKLGTRKRDNGIIGYAYYRYAYYHYFTVQDISTFRKYIPIAIKYLLRSDDREYLGSTYNLIAYDAQDQGFYDVAYAYYMIAVSTAEQVKDIALPGLVEASAGRLLIELGDCKGGLKRQRNAIKRMAKFTDMHVYNYNMILTYQDMAIASFRMGDQKSVSGILKKAEAHYEKSSREEKNLSKSYYLLIKVYEALLLNKDEDLETNLAELLKHWKKLPWSELFGLIFELETLCEYMLEHDYISQARRLLDGMSRITKDENLAIVNRYYTQRILYYEKIHDLSKLRECLVKQYDIQKKQKSEMEKAFRYSVEFSEMIEAIAKEMDKAREENIALRRRANTDALTGLPNRNAMNRVLQEKHEEAERCGTPFGIGVVDVNDFKQYNDTYGHQAGDRCLKHIGKALKKFNEDPRIFCCRYGGDEFVVGYFGLTTREIKAVARDMEKEISEKVSDTERKRISVSQGIYSSIPDGREKLWDYFTEADKKLYEIKRKPLSGRRGKN